MKTTKTTPKGYPKTNVVVLAIIAVLAVIGGAFMFYNNQKNSDNVDVKLPANIASCSTKNPIPAPEFVGLSADKAKARAKHNDMLYRVVSIDGKPQLVTLVGAKCGHAVNFSLVDGKVTKAEYY